MRGTVERTGDGILHGEEPVKYRMVFEIDPPAVGRKKDEVTGARDISRVELWSNEEHLFYWMQVLFARMGHQVTRAEAVIQEEGVVLSWQDRNPNERE